MRSNAWVAIGALSAFLAVAFGAFGAHTLRDRLDPADLEVWKTAVLYQALHALAMVAFGLFRARNAGNALPGWGFFIGTVLFCGSLYGLALGGPEILGPITPLGGLSFLFGWLILAWQAWRGR